MFKEINEAILKRLESKVREARETGMQGDADALRTPALYCTVEDGPMKRQGGSLYVQANVYVLVVFKHVREEEERRKGIYPIVEGVILALFDQDLGLDIRPLTPVRFRNATTDELDDKGLIAFQIQFETGFNLERPDDTTVTDLLTVGLSYYLQEPGDDGAADASDDITIEQGQ